MSLAFSLESAELGTRHRKDQRHLARLRRRVTGWNRLPDAIASWRMDLDWGHLRAAAILRQVGYQNTLTPESNLSSHKTGYGLNLTGAFNVLGKDSVTWQLAAGEAIATYMNDGGADAGEPLTRPRA